MSDLGNKEVFAKNLNYYMELNHKTRSDIAQITNVPYSTVASWCNALYYPRIDKIELLANYFNILKSDLVENKTDFIGNPVVSIPILGVVKAGYDYLAQENWIGTIDINRDIVKDGKDYFALYVHGDSMLPDFKEGDIVLVKKQNDFENGQVVIALINGDEATIKKAYKSNDGLLLQPINNSYQPLIFSKEDIKKIPVRIAGIVVQLQRKI